MTDDDLRAALQAIETGKLPNPCGPGSKPMTPADRDEQMFLAIAGVEKRGHFDYAGVRYTVVDGRLKRGLPI